MIMSSAVSTDWPIILPSVVEALNEMPQKKLRNFSPSEINNKLDDTKVHNAQKNILQCMRSLIGKFSTLLSNANISSLDSNVSNLNSNV